MAKNKTSAAGKRGKPNRKRARKVPELLALLRDHFSADPAGLPVVEQEFPDYHRANVHLTISDLLPQAGDHRLLGVVPRHDYNSINLPKLSRTETAHEYQRGPVEYLEVPLADDRTIACVKRGLYLFHDGKVPVALLIADDMFARHNQTMRVAIMAANQEGAEQFARKLAKGVRYGTAFRGKVLSIESGCHGGVTVRFHRLPDITRESLILPEKLLCRIERQAMGLTRHAEKLRAAGRHLKRGILMHGKPGTGKTLSAMYLAAQMPGRTVAVLTGGAVGSIETACALARLLEPATIVLEDVDLIGTERDQQSVGANAHLFELLNQMDGLGEDADILFILTTNRPDYLEPALAARPGRIDLAIEVPLPDDDCRRRLFDLYGRGLKLDFDDAGVWVRRTNGVSAAFIRELLRKAAILAAEEDGRPGEGDLVISDRHMEEATAELLVAGGALTKTLLGVERNGEE